MEEQLLHFIWHSKLFRHEELVTTGGQAVEIHHPGFPNHDQGPDFLQARIQIGDQFWAGHVEIHVRSSAWYLHTHESDPHYNTVILHVVWQEDVPVQTSTGFVPPCIELHDKVDKGLLDRYRHLMNNKEWIPCASAIKSVNPLVINNWLERLMSERLERKTEHIAMIHKRCGGDWDQTFFVMLCRHLGAPANSDAMENLGLKVPLNILRKHGDRPDQMESILFGVAGMLTKDLPPGYPQRLKHEFDFLKLKYGLHVIPALQWKFMRMRPVHFPTIRIAQLAMILSKHQSFLTWLEDFTRVEQWVNVFRVTPMEEYWYTHYHFKNESPPSHKSLGPDSARSLIINLVAPCMFYYGQMHAGERLKEKAIHLLAAIDAEKNSITKHWGQLGLSAHDALQSQALLHLKKEYCNARKCLHCAIGLQLLK